MRNFFRKKEKIEKKTDIHIVRNNTLIVIFDEDEGRENQKIKSLY